MKGFLLGLLLGAIATWTVFYLSEVQAGYLSSQVTTLADSLSEARKRALGDSLRADSLVRVGEEARKLKDSLKAVLAKRPHRSPPPVDSFQSVTYWRDRAMSLESDLADALAAVGAADIESDALRAAYETERKAAADLRRSLQVVEDSLRVMGPRIAKLEKQAGKVCAIGLSAGLDLFRGAQPALVVGVTCDGSRLLGRALGAIF